ncbi:MAG: hypothetical protein M1840_008235 [Geoglossum simile]|nr:MAG: hypothetical protein M1840_008235 [Geoglossum simile]
MDPYLDTIPDDRGEEIRMHVRERDGSNGEGHPTKHARVDICALLPLGGDGQEVEGPLKPEDDLDKYDHGRLQKGLRYINMAAKQTITPRTQEFLKLHKDAHEAALDGGAPEETSRASYGPELLANYGDYLGRESQADLMAAATGTGSEVRKESLEHGPPKTWLTIADGLADLRKHVNGWRKTASFTTNFANIYPNCHWRRVAEQVCRDLKELLDVAPDPDTAANYEKVLLSIQKEYFDVIGCDDPEYWFPNEKARKMAEEKMAREKKAQK